MKVVSGPLADAEPSALDRMASARHGVSAYSLCEAPLHRTGELTQRGTRISGNATNLSQGHLIHFKTDGILDMSPNYS